MSIKTLLIKILTFGKRSKEINELITILNHRFMKIFRKIKKILFPYNLYSEEKIDNVKNGIYYGYWGGQQISFFYFDTKITVMVNKSIRTPYWPVKIKIRNGRLKAKSLPYDHDESKSQNKDDENILDAGDYGNAE